MADAIPILEETAAVDIRIGVSQTAKEIDVELPADADADDLKTSIDQAIADGTTLWLTDRKGRQVGIPAEKIAYLEIGRPDDGRRIGFGG
jgi:hypothetical protein